MSVRVWMLAKPSSFTRPDFDRIQTGMTVAEVKGVLDPSAEWQELPRTSVQPCGPGSSGLPLQPLPGLREPCPADHGGLLRRDYTVVPSVPKAHFVPSASSRSTSPTRPPRNARPSRRRSASNSSQRAVVLGLWRLEHRGPAVTFPNERLRRRTGERRRRWKNWVTQSVVRSATSLAAVLLFRRWLDTQA